MKPQTYVGLGALCLGVAALYAVWDPHPAKTLAVRGRLPLWAALRWFHALAWVLLSVFCSLRAARESMPAAAGAAKFAALGALGVYVVYLAAMMRAGR